MVDDLGVAVVQRVAYFVDELVVNCFEIIYELKKSAGSTKKEK